MSKKKKGTQLDVLGETHLPEDLFSGEMGSNYGLDGFPDMEYGSGLEIQFDDVDTSGLPEGMTAGEEAEWESQADGAWFHDEEDPLGMDLTETMKEAGLNDLDWLELNEQDPDRLPENPVDLAIPELEEAWGVNRRTDGIHFFDNVDLDTARYEQSLKATGRAAYNNSTEDLSRVVRKAMRRSAAGHDIKAILREAAGVLGDEAYRIKSAMQLIKSEHGLAGNVFIRASAYPGYKQGKWKKTLRKLGKARFIIVDKRTLTGSTTVQNRRCTVTKKLAVLTVPWKSAHAYYAPTLRAHGHKVASDKNPQTTLRKAFLSEATPVARIAEQRPTHKTPSQRVSSSTAKQKLQAAGQVERKVYDRTATRAARDRRVAWAKVNTWVKAGLVHRETAMKLAGEDITGKELLHRVAAVILQVKGASAFSGMANDVRPPVATKVEAKAAMSATKVARQVIIVSDRPEKMARKAALQTLSRWVRVGFLSEPDAKKLAATKLDAEFLLAAASRLVFAPRNAAAYSGTSNDMRAQGKVTRKAIWKALRKAEANAATTQSKVDRIAEDRRGKTTVAARRISAAEAKVGMVRRAIDKGLRGASLREFIQRIIPPNLVKLAGRSLLPLLKESGALEEVSKAARVYQGRAYRPVSQRVASVTPAAREVMAMLRWTKRAMSEGNAGHDLDGLLQARFSSTVRTAGAEPLAELRDLHEGGSGFMYVDTSAYASKTGTTGCDKGGLKHRANGIKYALSMKRCNGCSLRSKKADGTLQCRKYRKELVMASELPAGIRMVRRANIKSANMDDAEATASMFADSFDPTEYDLRNASFDDIELDASPDAGVLGEILFGGMEF